MNKTSLLKSSARAAAVLSALAALSAQGATLYWDTNGTTDGLGGTGAWSTGTGNWSTNVQGTGAGAWATGDTAEFRGAGGTVTIDGGGVTTTHLVTDQTTGAYIFNGGPITVTATSGAGSTGAFYAVNGKGSADVTINSDVILNKSAVTGNQSFVFASASGLFTINGDISFSASASATGVKTISLRGTGADSVVYFNGIVGATPGGTASTLLQVNGSATSKTYISGDNSGLGGAQVVGGAAYLQNDLAFGAAAIQLSNSGTPENGKAAIYTDGARTIGNNISVGKTNDATTELTIGGGSAHVSNFTGTVAIGGGTGSVANLRFSAVSGGRTNFTNTISGSSTNSTYTKVGAGVVAFTRAAGNTYVGNTFVNEGALLAGNTSGSATGTGTVTVASGATLGGTGFITGPVVASAAGSIFSAGDMNQNGVSSIGTLTLSNGFTAANGATFNFDVNGASVDTINFGAGTVDIDGTVTVNFTSLGSVQTGTTYSLFAGSGDWSSVSASFTINTPTGYVLDSSFGGGLGYVFDSASHTFNVQFVSAAVPEPSTFAVLGGVVALGFAGLRRRRAVRA